MVVLEECEVAAGVLDLVEEAQAVEVQVVAEEDLEDLEVVVRWEVDVEVLAVKKDRCVEVHKVVV